MTKEQKEALQKSYDEAMAEFEALTKSAEDAKTPEELQKALDEIKAVTAKMEEALAKSDDKDADDKGKKKGDDDEDEEELARSLGFEDAEAMHKALGDVDEDDARSLVKASEAFESMAKSITDYQAAADERFDALQKSVDLMLKGFSALAKAQTEGIGALTKSLGNLGAAPVGRSDAKLGLGKKDDGGELKKSRGEIQMDLEDLQAKGELPPGMLAKFGNYGVSALTDEIRQKIGL